MFLAMYTWYIYIYFFVLFKEKVIYFMHVTALKDIINILKFKALDTNIFN
jgi:hypothetical protein